MADVCDNAEAIEAQFRDSAIQKNLNEFRNKALKDAEEFCIDCGDEIPQARREKLGGNCVRCVNCQEIYERKYCR